MLALAALPAGGESFLASPALGLADVVTSQSGGITLDTLFVDEGFGSLDADTLEIAMITLDRLRAGGRTIGLISHVEAMKEQSPAKLEIRVAPGGWSEILQNRDKLTSSQAFPLAGTARVRLSSPAILPD